jgi:hypothetical protein
MISVHLMGGLGNQLFQIATTLAYAIRNRITPMFPFSETLTTGVERPTYWDSLLKNMRKFTVAENSQYNNQTLFQLPKYHEPEFRYRLLPPQNHLENRMLVGYFQSYLYFDDVKQRILDIMGINHQRAQIKEDYAELLTYSPTNKFPDIISVHFRMGDYKTKEDYHPILPYEYYDRAFQTFSPAFLEKMRILYFCEEEDRDAADHIMERLQDKYYLQEIERVDHTIPDWKQMLIMSCCRINIIANSSFSWWAAYINDHPLKTVIYPSVWFGPKFQHMDVSDMCPKNDDWIKI